MLRLIALTVTGLLPHGICRDQQQALLAPDLISVRNTSGDTGNTSRVQMPPSSRFGDLFPVILPTEESAVREKGSPRMVAGLALVGLFFCGAVFIAYFFATSTHEKDVRASEDSTYSAEVWDILKCTWPLMLGNTLEWYEYGIYGYTANQMSANFFRGSAVATWMGYAMTFIARPFGGLVLGWIADTLGRTVSVQISLFGMLIATVGQGLLPGHYLGTQFEELGFVILIFFRAVQGLSAGGEIGAISSYMIESASLRTLGFSTCLISLGAALAFGLASTVVGMVNSYLSLEEMLVWGWRIPFLLSAIPGFIALLGRASITETESFKEESQSTDKKKREHFRELLTCYYPACIIGLFATVGIGTFWYVGPIWTVSSLLEANLSPKTALDIASASQWVATFVTPIIGVICDKKGIAWVTLYGSALIMIVCVPVWTTLTMNPANSTYAWVGIAGLFGVTQAFAGGVIYLFSAELFPTHLRTLGLGMSYNLAVSYFGGLGPVICEVLRNYYPLYGPGVWMSLCGAMSVLAVICGLRLQDKGVLQLTHRRRQPYFGAAYRKDGELIIEEASKDALPTHGNT